MRTMLLMVLMAGCAPAGGAVGRCNATNCGGCCDARGTCQLGNTASSCGARGAACGSCGLGLICSQAMCSVPSASVNTGAGGGSTSGGPRGGGTTGRAWQELTSGTRLRAMYVTSTDGARAPLTWGLNVNAIFWDSQLSLYCTPVAQGVASPRCEPLGMAYESTERGEFVDSTCTISASTANDPADLNRALAAAGLPTSTVTHLRLSDASGGHTYFTAMRVPSGAPRYYRSPETQGCIASGTFTESAWAAGSSVAVSTFASMSVTRD